MSFERKAMMVSARVPPSVIARVDYAVRNTEDDAVRNRSTALCVALEFWLASQEARFETLGLIPKKAAR